MSDRMDLINRIVTGWRHQSSISHHALHALVFGNIPYHSNGDHGEIKWIIDMIKNDKRCDVHAIHRFLMAQEWY